MSVRSAFSCLCLATICSTASAVDKKETTASFADLDTTYQQQIQPLLKQFCLDCHSSDLKEGELDLERFSSLAEVRRDPKAWLKVTEMLDQGEMPPKDSEPLSDAQHKQLRTWIESYLNAEALANAGDPGPVILRRLSNAEYNYTIRDLTGVDSLNPTREFPVDGAAGEGFTNAGSAQAMSPALVQKYLDAGKSVADHLVLLPDGITFSSYTTQRDQSDELVAAIRRFYDQYTVSTDMYVEVGGTGQVSNRGGGIPFAQYFAATLEAREELKSGRKTVAEIAKQRSLNEKYLGLLWTALTAEETAASPLMRQLQQQWQSAKPGETERLLAEIKSAQDVLWKFNSVGHIGRDGAPVAWMEAASPITSRREFNLQLSQKSNADVTLHLAASDAGDGPENDLVVWENPRLVGPRGPDILLRDLEGLKQRIQQIRRESLARSSQYLAAVAELSQQKHVPDQTLSQFTAEHDLDADALQLWRNYLAPPDSEPVQVEGHITEKQSNGTYPFISGWGIPATPVVLGNSSDQQVRIPGISRPHSIVLHPSPTLFIAAGWQSPISGNVRIEARLSDAHPECGNGQEFYLQHRTSNKVGNLWQGEFATGGSAKMPAQTISVRQGELVTFVLGPRAGNHTCDLTEIHLTISELDGKERIWDLAKDCSGNLQAANPHADSFGNEKVWHFYQGPMTAVNREAPGLVSVPAGSLLSLWQQETDLTKRAELAKQVQALATGAPPSDKSSADGLLYQQLQRLAFAPRNLEELLNDLPADDRFGKHASGEQIKSSDLIVQAPMVSMFVIPAELIEGRTFVTTGRLDALAGKEGSVKLEVSTQAIDPESLPLANPVVVNDDTAARQRVEAAFAQFRNLFPAALCYAKIVPVDEVVTLTLYYRQDDQLQRLMLNEEQCRELDRLWDELFYVAQEPLKYQVAFEQIREFATQDRPDLVKVWDPLFGQVNDRADAFRKRLKQTEPVHLEAVLEFAERAWRRPLSNEESTSLRDLYQRLRAAEISHEESMRLTLARVLTSPAFLYRLEKSPADAEIHPVTDFELASRLSYFLWSSLPDAQLRQVAATGQLHDDETLLSETHRMLQSPHTRRLAIQFSCQWLHIREFDQSVEKNEQLYPEFSGLRDDMYEESILFFEDLFRNDGSILNILNADYTFANPALAAHYGFPGVNGEDWQRIDSVKTQGRGGILGMATVLASQSGTSRTSPILRGNWVYETLLGEHLPKPPANVPQLPDEAPQGLSARELIEQHSSVAACARCHRKIDPYGFALEQFDTTGRLRPSTVDTKTTLLDGQKIEGLPGLRKYLLTERRDDFVRQFCRKLIGYSLGREVLLSDRPLIDRMMQNLAENDYRFSAAVETMVLSSQFRSIRGQQPAE